jgi:two-component system response regulator RegA
MNRRLLIVEDDAAFAGTLATAMEKRGFACAHAGDYSAAVRVAESFDPSHAIVDLKLPGESGLRVVAHLAGLLRPPRIVVLTGYASIATAVEAIKLGASQYLAKPASAADIVAALARDEANPDLDIQPQPLTVDRLEWEHIQKVLNEHGGNISATARALKMHRRTLQRKLDKHPPKIAQ